MSGGIEYKIHIWKQNWMPPLGYEKIIKGISMLITRVVPQHRWAARAVYPQAGIQPYAP